MKAELKKEEEEEEEKEKEEEEDKRLGELSYASREFSMTLRSCARQSEPHSHAVR